MWINCCSVMMSMFYETKVCTCVFCNSGDKSDENADYEGSGCEEEKVTVSCGLNTVCHSFSCHSVQFN